MNYLRKGLNMTSRKRQRKNYPFTWPRIYKYEELLENHIGEQLDYVIQEFYGVPHSDDLTEDQRKELLDYYHNDLLVNNEYSMYKIAFENLFNYWEMEY